MKQLAFCPEILATQKILRRAACEILTIYIENLLSENLGGSSRKILAWRGHEDIGGEGQLGREPGRPGGDQFFP